MNTLLCLASIVFLAIAAIFLVLKQHKANKHFHKSSHQLFSLLSISQDALLLLEKDNKIAYINDAMANLLKISTDQDILFESDMPNIYLKGKSNRFRDFAKEHLKQDTNELVYFPQIQIETRTLGKVAADLYLGETFDPKTKSTQLIVVIRDLREVIKEIASGERDHLTKLPNRKRAYKEFQALCSKHHLKQEKIALVAVSIDDFHITQSLLGHEETDETILSVAHTLKQFSVLHGYHIYHLSYSNFLLIFPKIDSIDKLCETLKTIQERISKLYEEHKSAAYLTASVGIAVYPESGNPVSLFTKAHQALIEARKYGLGNIHIYRDKKVKHDYNESQLRHDIQYAIKRNELMIYYQPIVDSSSRKIVAAEALMRWKHPDLGLIPPFVFIPIMEQTGFIVEAGKYLIKEVVAQQAKWKVFGFEEIVVSLNASMREVENSDYISYLSAQLKKHGVAPSTIKIEITESLAMNNPEKMLEILMELHRSGVSLSLDDFGTGYTSFAYLTKIPASTLKIDKSFINNILIDTKKQQVVKAIIEVGHTLDMKIVAEGIESAKLAKILTDYGCDYLQGYYFSKPVPAFEIQGQLKKKTKHISNINPNMGEDDALPLYDL